MENLKGSFRSQFFPDIGSLLQPFSRSSTLVDRESKFHVNNKLHRNRDEEQGYSDSFIEEREQGSRILVVNGKDIGDLPTEYEVSGLKQHEFPVIGTFVHGNILPGFTYIVRKLNTNNYLFKRKPLTLQSIGCGYGKRITFASELKNNNNNYFYSDTNSKGVGFSIVAIQPNTTFTVLDHEARPVGEGVILEVGLQMEESSNVDQNRTIVKKVSVTFTCDVKYGPHGHGLMPLFREDTMELTGTAVITKSKSDRTAVTECIEVELPNLGPCTFHLD